MIVEPAPDGWFIERDHRYYHLNQAWLDDMFRHQVKPYGNNPAYNRLVHAFQSGADADEIAVRFTDFYDNRSRPGRGQAQVSEFQQFVRGHRGRNG